MSLNKETEIKPIDKLRLLFWSAGLGKHKVVQVQHTSY